MGSFIIIIIMRVKYFFDSVSSLYSLSLQHLVLSLGPTGRGSPMRYKKERSFTGEGTIASHKYRE